MFVVGEVVKWRLPLEEDYSYGTILKIYKKRALVIDSGYYAGKITEVQIRYLEKHKRGGKGFGGSKEHSKRPATKSKL